MEFSPNLKRLYDLSQILYKGGADEQTALEQLQLDARFGTIQLSDVRYLYVQFYEKDLLEKENTQLAKEIMRLKTELDSVENKRRKTSTDDVIFEADLIQLQTMKNDFLDQLVQLWNKAYLLRHQKKRLTGDHFQLSPHRRKAEQCLISNWSSRFMVVSKAFWHDRIALGRPFKRDSKTFVQLTDLFHQDLLNWISIPGVGAFSKFHALVEPYVLLVENDDRSNKFSLFLVEFDPSMNQMQLIQTIKDHGSLRVFVDSANPKKFILRNRIGIHQVKTQVCTLAGHQIQIDKEVDWKAGPFSTYYNNQLLTFVWRGSRLRMREPEIRVLDLAQNNEIAFNVEPLPANVRLGISMSEFSSYAWLQDRCFLPIEFVQCGSFGIVSTDAKTRVWTVIQFALDHPIRHIQPVDDFGLMVAAAGRNVHKLLIRKPDLLRNMAWSKVIGLFKSKKEDDPYAKALECLPLNSELQPFMRL